MNIYIMGPKLSSKSPEGSGGGRGGGGGIALNLVDRILTKLAPSDAYHDFGTNKPKEDKEKVAYKKGLFGGSNNVIDYLTEADSLSMVVSKVNNVVNPNHIPLTEHDITTPSVGYNPDANYIPIHVANLNKDYYKRSSHTITIASNPGVEPKTYTVNYADVKCTPDIKRLYKNIMTAKESKDASAIATAESTFDAAVKVINDKAQTLKDAAARAKAVKAEPPPPEGFITSLKAKIDKSLAELTGSSKGGGGGSSEKDSREEIDAPMFYDMLKLDPNQNIALVVDAASIGIFDILSRGTFTGGIRPKVYYIYGPEVVNDPAKKKHPSAPEFTKTEGVLFIPCVSMNPHDFVYCYDYKQDPTGLYLNKFFTSFEFGLSELQETVNGKTIDYTTDLTIKAFDGGDKNKVKFIDESIDSKSKSDITFLTEMINMLRAAIASGNEKEFQYAISYLKKMSGDWLQVLLAVAIAMRSRGFTPYAGPTAGAAAAGGGAAGGGGGRGAAARENICRDIHRVFFLTHDQIALAFALLNGVECIFTHHTSVEGEGNPSLHSVFLYSLMSKESVDAFIIDKATKLTPTNYAAEIATLTANIEEYDGKRFASIRGPVDTLNAEIKDDLDKLILTEGRKFNVNWFDRYVKTLFTASLKIVAIKKILPDLKTISSDPKSIKLDELTAKNAELQTALGRFKSNKNVEIAKQLLELDAYVDSQIKSCQKTIDSAQHFFIDDGGGELKINKEIREFTKELIYVAAANWTWDSPEVSTRKLGNLTSMRETQAFNADRNIFINHLNSLDDDIKSQITLIFARCYDFIEQNNDHTQFQNTIGKSATQPLTPPQFHKFKPMATTFCYEVFINLGGKYNIPKERTTETITKRQIDGYCDRILAVSALTSLLDLNNISASENTKIVQDKLVANHTSEIVLVDQMTQPDNGGIESFSQERIFSAEEIGASSLPSPPSSAKTSASPPPAPPGKPGKNSMRFSSVSAACQLLKERILSNPEYKGARGPLFVDGGAKNRAMRMKGGAAPMCNFHHQLPLCILLFQLRETLSNENFEESLDYELTLQYYGFLLKIQDEFARLKEEKDKEKEVKIGLGIRDFFFINNVVSDDVKVKELPPILQNIPSKMLSFSGLLTTGFCGALNEEYFKNVGDREASIKDPVFVDFITNMQIPEYFNGQLDSEGVVYKDFIKAVSQSANEVAQQIIADREGERQQMINESVSNVADIYKFKEGSKGIAPEAPWNVVPPPSGSRRKSPISSSLRKSRSRVKSPTSSSLRKPRSHVKSRSSSSLIKSRQSSLKKPRQIGKTLGGRKTRKRRR